MEQTMLQQQVYYIQYKYLHERMEYNSGSGEILNKNKLSEKSHQAIDDNVGYKDEAEEQTYGIFHLLQN
jgi:hypothetical protein